jgi:tetratricopeptide (TPR) repeat protein
MAKGDYAAACEAFRASDALDPAIGTEFNLGVCLRKLGKLDEACEAFEEAHAKAIVKGQDDRVKLLEEAMTSVPCAH